MPVLLAASVAVPYAANQAPEWRDRWAASSQPGPTSPPWPNLRPGSLPSLSRATPPGATTPLPSASASLPTMPGGAFAPTLQIPASPSAAAAPLEGSPTYALAEVVRMDVTKEWVYQRWARKSTALAELDLYGVRVPLVTGAKVTDLAGSLTYYFTQDGRVQRIAFRGRTGDTTELVALATQRYGLQWQTPGASGEQLLEARRGEDVVSRLRTRPAPVLWANSPNESFAVELDLQDPAAGRPLPSLAAPLPPLPPATPSAAESSAGVAKSRGGDKKTAAAREKSAEQAAGWRAFFPRSRVPKPQIKGLDANNLYR